MPTDPRLVAEFLREEQIANPPEEVAFQRNLKLAVTQQGFVRGPRITDFVPKHVLPAIDAEQVYVENVNADDLQALYDAGLLQGRSIYAGSGAPSGGLGAVGDLYIDAVTGNLYEKT